MKLKLLYYLIKNILKNTNFYEPNQDKIRKLQFRRLRKILNYAYSNTEIYYTKYKTAGINPREIKTINDFEKIPVLTRSELSRAFPDKIVTPGYVQGKNCYLAATSGSTGEPIKVLKTYDSIFSIISLGSKKFVSNAFQLNNLSIMTILVYAEETIEQIMTDFLMQTKRIPFRKVNALDEVENYIRAINVFRPTILFTYPSVLKDIALYLNETGEEVYSPNIILTSAEILERNFRDDMKKYFKQSLILDTYFCTEGGAIAGQCREGDKMHVRQDKILLEILENGLPVKPGESGEVVFTDLENFATPIIRYNGLRDIARFSEENCKCGAPGLFLEMVEGRKVDTIITPSGRIINPFRLTEIVSVIEGVGKYQIVQKYVNEIDVKIIAKANSGTQEKIRGEVEERFKLLLNENILINVEFHEELPRDPRTGMFQLVKSEVEQ